MGWNHKEQKQGAARFQTLFSARTPTPYPMEDAFRPVHCS